MSVHSANPEMLTLGRESRGYSQAALAAGSRVSQGYISKGENGLIEISGDRLEAIARELRYPVPFFLQDEHTAGVHALFHRRLRSVKIGELKQIQAQLNIMRIQVKRLLHGVTIEAPYAFPKLDVDEVGGPARAAQIVRRAWLLPLGPVVHLVRSIEAAGGVVVPIHISTDKISAAAQWPVGEEHPYFFVNSAHSGERQRFSMAHEIAHMVLHAAPEEDQEDQADHFASELLMPEAEIRPQLTGRLTLARLVELKHYWKVSLAALVRRAGQLGILDQTRVSSMFKMLSARGWRKIEPAPIPPEQPEVLRAVLRTHREDHGYTTEDLSQLSLLRPDEFERVYGSGHSPKLPPRARLHVVA